MTDYNVIFVLPGGKQVKDKIENDITFQNLKQVIGKYANSSTFSLALSSDGSKPIKAVNWTKLNTIDTFKKSFPLGLINNNEIEFNDNTDSFICKIYVL
ncbi:hypothetical protein DFA_01190 [Cavenderia fasciculata]|uniref:Uncharacterized protein n=1 Tax=Cavenderia fasciculata TaxID=261658 RepID=F4PRA9_CACFS|nr:uncharacterized protein DFA_01190 [Cavenderia fasciculata]EGG21309.1 hypothetical protein DFA_01190 [Cavenderia fasciculata]|eukprot:XP_004359159.1 hypothetical protein DFA_01190 [Cavenderia fasciculata]